MRHTTHLDASPLGNYLVTPIKGRHSLFHPLLEMNSPLFPHVFAMRRTGSKAIHHCTSRLTILDPQPFFGPPNSWSPYFLVPPPLSTRPQARSSQSVAALQENVLPGLKTVTKARKKGGKRIIARLETTLVQIVPSQQPYVQQSTLTGVCRKTLSRNGFSKTVYRKGMTTRAGNDEKRLQ